MQNLFITILLALILSSCVTQTPAPIEYGSTGATPKNDDYYGSSIKEKTTVTTNWGDQQHKEEPENLEYTDDQNKEAEPVIAAAAKPKEDIYHEVIEGETLDSIAIKYNVSKEAIITKNDLAPPYQLEELQIIIIPGESKLKIDNLVKASTTPVVPSKSIRNMPVEGKVIAAFGTQHMGSINQGINIEAPLGTDIHAVTSGEVIHSGNDPKFGNLIIVRSIEDDIFTAYAHMEDLIVRKGDNIMSGQLLGHVGKTGKVNSPQLHFAVRKGKIPIDPIAYINS